MNKGVCFSKGDWICFLDSDDEYQENHLEVLYKAISQNKEFFIFRTGSTCIDIKGNVVKTKMKECNQLLCTYPFEFIHFFAFNKIEQLPRPQKRKAIQCRLNYNGNFAFQRNP